MGGGCQACHLGFSSLPITMTLSVAPLSFWLLTYKIKTKMPGPPESTSFPQRGQRARASFLCPLVSSRPQGQGDGRVDGVRCGSRAGGAPALPSQIPKSALKPGKGAGVASVRMGLRGRGGADAGEPGPTAGPLPPGRWGRGAQPPGEQALALGFLFREPGGVGHCSSCDARAI